MAIIRECAERYIHGESASAIVTDLNARGVPTAQGKQWRVESFMGILLKKRYLGIREHNGKEYPAQWPAILTQEQWDRIEARRLSTARNWAKSSPIRKYVLTGLVYCGRCGEKLQGAGRYTGPGKPPKRRYRCKAGASLGLAGCGRTHRAADPLELLVTEAVLHVFDDPNIAVMLAPPHDEQTVRQLVSEFERRKAKLGQLVTDYATDLLNREQFALAKSIAEAGIVEAREALAAYQDAETLALISAEGTLREAWDTASLQWRHNVIALVVERVIVHPAHVSGGSWRGYKFNPDLIEIKWRV